jgi:hypothetical protein
MAALLVCDSHACRSTAVAFAIALSDVNRRYCASHWRCRRRGVSLIVRSLFFVIRCVALGGCRCVHRDLIVRGRFSLVNAPRAHRASRARTNRKNMRRRARNLRRRSQVRRCSVCATRILTARFVNTCVCLCAAPHSRQEGRAKEDSR